MADTDQTPTDSTDLPPLPPRIALFAPWRWLSRMKPGRRYTLIGALLVLAYIEAPVPLIYTLRRTHPTPPPLVQSVLQVTFAPLEWCYYQNDFVQWFYDSQWELIGQIAGQP
jgi:hypothetical protein